MARPLQINCENCGLAHFVRAPRSPKSLSALIIDFDICPFCSAPRSMMLFKKYWGRSRCWFCGVPLICLDEPEKGKYGLCGNHFISLRHQIKDWLDMKKELEGNTAKDKV